MQLDFRHTTISVMARAAGFDRDKVQIIAYDFQYLDDASSSDVV